MPAVPKKPEPEKKVPPPSLKKAVAPPAKGTPSPTRVCLLHSCWTVVLSNQYVQHTCLHSVVCHDIHHLWLCCALVGIMSVFLFVLVYFMLFLYICRFWKIKRLKSLNCQRWLRNQSLKYPLLFLRKKRLQQWKIKYPFNRSFVLNHKPLYSFFIN